MPEAKSKPLDRCIHCVDNTRAFCCWHPSPHCTGSQQTVGCLAAQAAARIVLQDWNDGRIPFFTRPPKRDDHGEAAAAIVPTWGAEFDAEAVRGGALGQC